MQENKNNVYTYSAPTELERRKVQSIVKDYMSSENKNPYERLLEIDKKVKMPPTVVSLTLGIIGTLIFGLGMALCLEFMLFIPGVIISVAGIIPLAIAYPVYNLMLKKNKDKYRDEILKLGQELLN